MDLNVSLDAARARKSEAAIGGMSNGSPEVSQQQQRKRKANRDSWPFMHAIMLLECFKDIWTKSNMGNLTMAQWTEVSNKVNEACGINMNEQQCRTKVDNLKKRYKRERMKYAPTGHTSPWEFYGVMNKLFGNTTKLSTTGASPVSGQPAVGDNAGDDTEGSDEDDVVVLDNGGDLIFNIPGAREMGNLHSTSPQALARPPHTLLLEGVTEHGIDNSPNENSDYQDGGFSSSPRLKRMSRTNKRKRNSAVCEGYGELLKEVEKERSVDWQRKLVELAKVDKKRPKNVLRLQDGRYASGGLMDGQEEGDEFDDFAAEYEKRREDMKCRALYDAEHKVELASKAYSEAHDERERLEREIRIFRESSDYRKALTATLKPSFKKLCSEKIIPAERINVSLNKFPYYLSDVTRDFLMEAVASALDQLGRPPHLASSNVILLNGPQNTEIFQEALVKAIAHDQGVSLLILDSTDLAPQDYDNGEDFEDAHSSDVKDLSWSPFRKGDRVVSRGSRKDGRLRRGRVVAISENSFGKIGILFDTPEDAIKFEEIRNGVIEWHYASDFEKDELGDTVFLAEWQGCFSALCEISKTAKPLIVYFLDIEQWFQRGVPAVWKHEMLDSMQKQFDKLNGNVAFLASFTSDGDEPAPLISKWTKQRLKSMHSLFTNVVDIFPPKDDLEFWRWKMQLSQDSDRVKANKNIQILQRVLISHNVVCTDFMDFQICEFALTSSDAETVLNWALNYEYANSHLDKTTKVSLSAGSLDRALIKLRRLKHAQGLKIIAKDAHEEVVLSTVVSPNGGPKFEDVGALEDVKKILGELVVLPLLRPEHFSKGALASPCKGVLLYGPPGTGKSLLTKAVANQSSANLIWLKGSSIDYKWLEDPKSMIRTLFSLARKLAPSIIFVDEIDSIFSLQANEAMNRLKFEFLYGWDRFMSRPGESVIVMAATYRPFDLDETVVQKFPRRLCVDLPDAASREKILHVLLAKEEIENGFHFKGVAGLTEGFSGNDLKNLTVAAAYRPVREMLEVEKAKGNVFGQEALSQELRPLTIQDFVSALEEVNVSYNAGYLEQLRQWDAQCGSRW